MSDITPAIAGQSGGVLNDALASLGGRVVDTTTVGSHSVMFVEVADIVVRGEGDSLI